MKLEIDDESEFLSGITNKTFNFLHRKEKCA